MKTIKLNITTVFFLAIFILNPIQYLQAQNVGINATATAPDPSAILDLNTGNNWASPNGKGMLVPCMNTAAQNAIVSPATGLIIYNTDCPSLNYWNGTTWIAMGSVNAPASPAGTTNTPTQTQIVWNWTASVGATSYQWNNTNNYPGTGINVLPSNTFTQTSLSCNTTYTLYVWASNNCGTSSTTALTQTTLACSGAICGTQVWTAANLNTGTEEASTTFGDQTPGNKWCYNDLPANCGLFGGLYDWQNAMGGPTWSNTTLNVQTITCDPCTPTSGPAGIEGLCPSGYHIPSDLEWSQYEFCTDPTITLAAYQTTSGFRGTNVGNKLKLGSASPGFADGSSNSSGFSGVPGGFTSGSSSFADVNLTGSYWSATEINTTTVWDRYLETSFNGVNRAVAAKKDGASIRCLHN